MLRLSVIYVRTFYLTFHCLPPRTISWFFIVSQQIICSTNASLNLTFILLIIMECLHFDIWKWYIWFIWYIGWIVWCFSCVHSQLLLKGVFAEHHPGSDVPLYAFMCSSHLKNAMSGRQFYPNLLCYVNSLKFQSSTCWSQQWIFSSRLKITPCFQTIVYPHEWAHSPINCFGMNGDLFSFQCNNTCYCYIVTLHIQWWLCSYFEAQQYRN